MKLLAILFACALTCSQAAIAQQEPILIRFSHVVASDTPKGKAAERFRQLAEQATGGRVRVQIYPNSQLYRDREELEALQLGAVEMIAPSLSKLGPLGAREFQVFDLPFMFPDRAALHRVTNGPIGEGMLQRLRLKGVIGLAFWDNGFKSFSANRPLLSPADMVGLRMRIQPSRVLDAQMRALGAQPMTLQFGEVHDALEAGVVDGTENPPSNFYTQGMQEVQSHFTVSNHGYLGYAVIVNRKFWEGLPPDVRRQLEGAMREATSYANSIAQEENDRALAAIRASGKTQVHVLTEPEREAWKKALASVGVDMEAHIGADLISDIRRAIAAP
ncbi:TRAP transporter substrate-binding protein [uncultured Castellaniella sp.]|uniref:TRAP transporter substrate-binding protein n=1 Tax=uncultured Castellaniella sp. TaxID=647907 RepID=UPI00262BAFE3|nr:TRAP transporter substrate-binding protein [uncultured Castellaniella sp.]